MERAGVCYSTPDTGELKPTPNGGRGPQQGGAECHGEAQEDDDLEDEDELAKLPSFFSSMDDPNTDDTLE